MRALLETLEKAYDYPVDIEFTTNFLPDGSYRINLVQCRPFQVKGGGPVVALPEVVADADLVLKTQGAVIGPSLATAVGRLIYVVPSVYSQLSLSDRYSIARLIGRLTRLEKQPDGALLLVGPGRWGTAEPTLGVPVSFAEISRVTALCEIIEMREGLVPDVSLGTHFFNDLVEMQVLYLALIPGKEGNCVNTGPDRAGAQPTSRTHPGGSGLGQGRACHRPGRHPRRAGPAPACRRVAPERRLLLRSKLTDASQPPPLWPHAPRRRNPGRGEGRSGCTAPACHDAARP